MSNELVFNSYEERALGSEWVLKQLMLRESEYRIDIELSKKMYLVVTLYLVRKFSGSG